MTNKTMALMVSSISFLLLLLPLVPPASATSVGEATEASDGKSLVLDQQTHFHVVRSTCSSTIYPDLCVETLTSFREDLREKDISEIVARTIQHVQKRVQKSSSRVSWLSKKTRNPCELMALEDCQQLFDGTLEELDASLKNLNSDAANAKAYDVNTLLSAAMTNQYTCLDGFTHCKGWARSRIEKNLYNITKLVSNSLAIAKKIDPRKEGRALESGEPFPEYGGMRHGFPRWVSADDRRLLQAEVTESVPDLVVAKDGRGDFTTISEAVALAPNKSATRFVIYIRAGVYLENVNVPSYKPNIMLIGEGMWKTVVKANRNVRDGWTTYRSATVGVSGEGFMARDITFQNSAGPSKEQAVAFRSRADRTALYRCSIAGFQDTLYVHSLRQFYRECDVYGTVDFIFGNAAAVLQNCNLYARRPNPKQKIVFTAQGRADHNMETGISIQSCKLAAAKDLIPVQSDFPAYLGRPWKQYSRTVYMNSYLGDLIVPEGWLKWNETFALDTLYYGEYMNRGPGSNTANRVTWPGYRVISDHREASHFSLQNFLKGDEWLPQTGFPFNSGLE